MRQILFFLAFLGAVALLLYSIYSPSLFFLFHGEELDARVIMEEVNRKREEGGLEPLSFEEGLSRVAKMKVERMLEEQYFDHVSPKGDSVESIAEEMNYEFSLLGDNLIKGYFRDEQEVVRSWMDSEEHRENILREDYENTGVALGYGDYEGERIFMAVQVFSAPPCTPPDDDLIEKIEQKEERIEELGERIIEEDAFQRHHPLVMERNSLIDEIDILMENYERQLSDYEDCLRGD